MPIFLHLLKQWEILSFFTHLEVTALFIEKVEKNELDEALTALNVHGEVTYDRAEAAKALFILLSLIDQSKVDAALSKVKGWLKDSKVNFKEIAQQYGPNAQKIANLI